MRGAVPDAVQEKGAEPHARAHSERTHGHGSPGIRLGRVAGVELFIDWSVAIIFALVAVGLGAGVLPRWHPDWSAALRWSVALAAAIAFFGSILLHELSHALVGRANGIAVPRITLFVFGGLAHLQGEPATPKAEFLMAVIGPITSIVIGFVATFAGVALLDPRAARAEDPEILIHSAGPVATLLLWLGPINFMLGVFNLVPGFPLDGGRVLRALLWWQTGDLEKATRWASGAGRAVGGALMVAGVMMIFGFRVPIFGAGFGSGIWIALIGWFLHNAARASYIELRVRRRLERVPVREVMRPGLDTVTPQTTIAELVSEHVMRTDQTSFPVLDGTALVGSISTRDIQRVLADRWPFVTVAEVMTTADDVPSIEVDARASKALEALADQDVEQLPVVDHGQLRGFVRRQDILKWLTLQPDVAQ
jgi:Zn-dependent protease/CBS domain-containing protein